MFRALDLAGGSCSTCRATSCCVLYYFVAFNVLLAIFNLLPVPPLDGSAILYRLAARRVRLAAAPVPPQYGFIFLHRLLPSSVGSYSRGS